jgi:DNA polymerase III epsilon subunit-like protein
MKPKAFIDVETTGLDPRKHEIIEIAVKSPHGIFHSLVRPRRIECAEPGALRINGYAENPQLWEGAPLISDVLPRVMDLLAGCTLAGHNVGFDKEFLAEAHLEFYGKGLPFYHCFDTVTLAMEHLDTLPRFNLTVICECLGISNVGAHTALADVLRCESVYLALIRATKAQRARWKKSIASKKGSAGA